MAKKQLKDRLEVLKDCDTLQLTTKGRVTGKRHTVTTWFVFDEGAIYLATMNMKRDWPRNIRKNGYAELDIEGTVFKGHAERITDAKCLERVSQLLADKYWAAWLGSWVGFGPDGAFAVKIDG